jgi:hypothetical protein
MRARARSNISIVIVRPPQHGQGCDGAQTPNASAY